MQHLFSLLVSARAGDGRRAVHLHRDMSMGRVVLDPRKIGCVPSQLVFNRAPICIVV
jgi:hypothetical protein